MEEKIKLSDDLMNNVSAGYLYFNGDKWLVIDIRGAVVKMTDNYDEATAYINENASDKLDGEDYELIDNQIK